MLRAVFQTESKLVNSNDVGSRNLAQNTIVELVLHRFPQLPNLPLAEFQLLELATSKQVQQSFDTERFVLD